MGKTDRRFSQRVAERRLQAHVRHDAMGPLFFGGQRLGKVEVAVIANVPYARPIATVVAGPRVKAPYAFATETRAADRGRIGDGVLDVIDARHGVLQRAGLVQRGKQALRAQLREARIQIKQPPPQGQHGLELVQRKALLLQHPGKTVDIELNRTVRVEQLLVQRQTGISIPSCQRDVFQHPLQAIPLRQRFPANALAAGKLAIQRQLDCPIQRLGHTLGPFFETVQDLAQSLTGLRGPGRHDRVA